MLAERGLRGFADREAYWLDIGTPERYLQGTADILSGARRGPRPARGSTRRA